MRKYKNLPSINVELLDGNLIVDNQVSGPVTLVIGTAYSGPTNEEYLVTDSNIASNTFGADSPLIRKMSEVKLGGSKNILLYRIGGSASQLVDILGEGTLIGTKEQTSSSGSKYSIYLGPSSSNPSISGLIAYEGDKIVYSDMNGAEVDLDVIEVIGDTKAYAGTTIGTMSAPVPFKDVMSLLATTGEIITVLDTVETSYQLVVNTDAVSIDSVSIDSGAALIENTDYTITGTSGVDLGVTIIGSLSASITAGQLINVTTSGGTTPGIEDLTVILSGTAQDLYLLNSNTASVSSVLNGATLLDEGIDYTITGTVGALILTFLVAQGIGDSINVNGVPVDIPGYDPDPYYTPGADNIDADWRVLYELLSEAYTDLETTIATHLVISDIILDAANIADGDLESSALAYLRTEETEGVVSYHWSTDKIIYTDLAGTGETNDPGLALQDENGQPVVKYIYNEVNFAHQMGSWLHSITENDRIVLGSIGTSGPISTSTASVSKWVGTLPTTNHSGAIVSNGSGLLGNKYMTGTTTQVPGFYATDSGFPDGNVMTDSSGAPVDLGKFFSVVMGMGFTANTPSLGLETAIINTAGIYIGLISTLVPGQSTTNRVLPGIATPFILKKVKLDELAYAGYVALIGKSRGVVVASGDLPTGPNSDYDFVSTSITIGAIVTDIRSRLDPYLGNALNAITLSAADTAIGGILAGYVTSGAIKNYNYRVLSLPPSQGKGKMNVPITIYPAFELRSVDIPIKLAYDA